MDDQGEPDLEDERAYAVAVDIGGTFTDLVAFDYETGAVVYTKSPTSYGDFIDGILDCFRKTDVAAEDAVLVNHGTTLVINALIQRRGAKTALVTTAGFRDLLEIARGNRPDPFDLHYQRDEPLIPRELRFEVPERIDARGTVVSPIDLAALEEIAAALGRLSIESVAVFFMNSYANPAHEEAAAELLRRELPDAYVTVSTDLTREWYEYERTSTVAANAFVGPQVNSYIRRLNCGLVEKGFEGSLFMMGSNGGLLSVERTCRQPIGLVESGPVGGCIGASAYADALGLGSVIAFDMGGTTAKCALIEDGSFSVGSIYYAAGHIRGFPIRSPVIDIVEVGSGGGSVAWADPHSRLHVGPRSAGSTPGPACYGRGGQEPTVTDANLVLGRLNPSRFLGGELALDVDAARAAIGRVAEPLGYTGDDGAIRMAEGILSIATVIMSGAIRQVSIEHGLDPREFTLFCYGGGGPLHASALARELSIPTVVVPPEPGNFSALGMLLADARLDLSETYVAPLEPDAMAAIEGGFAQLEQQAAADLEREFGARDQFRERYLEMRYRGQQHNIKVAVSGAENAAVIREIFDRDYRKRYGHADSSTPVEVRALHLSAFARLRPPDLSRLPRAAGVRHAGSTRPVYFSSALGTVESRVLDRNALEPGFSGTGPAVIEEYGSTTLVWPGDRFEIGALREIRVEHGQE